MIDEKLLNKFARVKDLPVSEELLGAYLEDNLDNFDSSQIMSAISSDEILSDLLERVSVTNNEEKDLAALNGVSFNSGINSVLQDITFPINFEESSTILNELAECLDFGANDVLGIFPDHQFASDYSPKENFILSDSFSDDSHSLDSEVSNDEEMFNNDSMDF